MEFVIVRNPDPASTLPFLLRLPLGSRSIILKAKATWPRTAKVFCHPASEWPDPEELEIVERVPVTSCVRRGVAIDLVLDRARENRSQFVFTKARGRDVVFWQSARTRKQARPNVAVPTARASGRRLDIVVDTRERYAWKFSHQQATTSKRALPVGDYAVEADGEVVAVVERKSIEDLVSTIVGGKLWTLLAAMAANSHAAVVVDDRYSSLFKLTHVRPASVAEQIAEAAVRYPTCRSCSPKPASSHRSGRIDSLVLLSSTEPTMQPVRTASTPCPSADRCRHADPRRPRFAPGRSRRAWT